MLVVSCFAIAACDRAAKDTIGFGADNPAVDELFARWDQPGSPGCAVAVSQDGELIYSRGYGYANLDYDVPNTPSTTFDVASVTKQFVAASISMLELEGKLSFNDDIRKWLPEMPEYDSPVTLSHMLYHISGLRDYLTLFPLAGRDDYFPISHPQILAMMSRQRALEFTPGEDYEYSNTAYMLLAQVIERVSGQSIGEFIQERIFNPLQMNDSLMYDDHQRVIPQRAIGYERGDNDNVRMLHNFNFDVVGDGQIYASVEDLIRWDNFLHESRPPYYDTLMIEGTLNNKEPLERAKGLYLDEYRGLRTVHHTGSSWGFNSVIKRFRDAGLTIVVACNDDNSWPRWIAFRIADHYLAAQLGPVAATEDQPDESDEQTASEEPYALSPTELMRFLGSYYSYELDATYQIRRGNGGLVVHIEQEQPIPLIAAAADRLEFQFQPQGWSGNSTVQLDVRRNDVRNVTGFDLSVDTTRGIIFERR